MRSDLCRSEEADRLEDYLIDRIGERVSFECELAGMILAAERLIYWLDREMCISKNWWRSTHHYCMRCFQVWPVELLTFQLIQDYERRLHDGYVIVLPRVVERVCPLCERSK